MNSGWFDTSEVINKKAHWLVHHVLKRKIQRLLKVNFVHRNFIRQDLQKVRQSRATNRVSGAATIESFQYLSTLATPSHPKFSKEHPNWKFWACVHCSHKVSCSTASLPTILIDSTSLFMLMPPLNQRQFLVSGLQHNYPKKLWKFYKFIKKITMKTGSF